MTQPHPLKPLEEETLEEATERLWIDLRAADAKIKEAQAERSHIARQYRSVQGKLITKQMTEKKK